MGKVINRFTWKHVIKGYSFSLTITSPSHFDTEQSEADCKVPFFLILGFCSCDRGWCVDNRKHNCKEHTVGL